MEKDLIIIKIKNRKRINDVGQGELVLGRGPSRWSKWFRNSNHKRVRVARAQVEKKNKRSDRR